MKNKIIKILLFLVLGALITFGSYQSAKAWNGIATLKPYTPEMVEMRAVWVATVSNIDFRKQDGTSEAAINDWKARYIKVLDNAQEKNLNTIIFQIRPNNDAFYPSRYNPWSEYLVGYGVDPGWDPLEWMLEVTHERGMEFHAWLNPYRTSTAHLTFDFKQNVAGTNGDCIVDYDEKALDTYKETFFGSLKTKAEVNGKTYDNPIFGEDLLHDVVLGAEDKFVLNPASENVLDHLNNTITEIIENYDVDGIHFDDYFYPNDTVYKGDKAELKGYTFSTEPYRDMEDYKAYKEKGGNLSIYNWRRENIDTLIKNLSDIIRDLNKTKEVKCSFGVSPCARWAPNETCTAFERGAEGGMGNDCNNYYAYSDLFADTRKWALEEWIDYIVPQCYTNLDSAYADIVSWWSKTLKDSNTKLYIGQGIYQIPTWKDKLEMLYQVRYNQSFGYRVDGYYFYNYTSVISGDGEKAMNTLSNGIWKRNSLTPTYAAYEYSSEVKGNIEITDIIETANDTLIINFKGVEGAKAYMLVEYDGNVANLDLSGKKYVNLVYGSNLQIEFTPAEGKEYVLVPIAKDNSVKENYTKVDLNMVIKNNIPEVTLEEIPSEVLAKTSIDVIAKIKDTDNTVFDYEVLLAVDSDEFTKVASGQVEGDTIVYTWKTYVIAQENIRFKVIVNDGKDKAEAISNSFSVVEKAAPVIWNITYNLDGGTITNAPTTYEQGTTTALVNPTKEGYEFTGWLLNGEKVTSINSNQTGNVTLLATWKEIIKEEPVNPNPQPQPGQNENKGCSCASSSAEIVVSTLTAVSLAILILRKNRG